jgi:hypothetical protein
VMRPARVPKKPRRVSFMAAIGPEMPLDGK